MKTKISTIIFLSFFALTALRAEEIELPLITKPAALEEGVQRELSTDQINELLPWAKDSKLFLQDIVDNTQSLSVSDRIDRLAEGIKGVVGENAPKNSELFMRYILNRAVVLNELLKKEMITHSVGTSDAQLRVLLSSIKMAIKYSDSDLGKLKNNKSKTSYAAFGIEYFSFLKEINKSIFDASAQYNMERTALEWLQWDLYRDLNNTSYAPKIVKINNALKTFPLKNISDSQAISYIRQIKNVGEQLKILIQDDKNNSDSKIEKNAKVDIGTLVIDEGGNMATVKSIFANGQVLVDYSIIGYGTGTKTINNLSPSVTCLGELCEENKVACNSQYIAKVKRIFANGKVFIDFESDSYTDGIVDQTTLAKEVNCTNNLCAGDKALYNNNYTGTVVNAFENGTVFFRFDNKSYTSGIVGHETLAKQIR